MSHNYGKPTPTASAINRLPAVVLFLAVALFIASDILLDFDFNWVDYAIVIIVALFGFRGYLKGIINTICSLGGYIIGLICATIFSPKLALIAMQKTSLGESIGEKINDIIPTLSSISAIKINDAQSTFDFIKNNPDLSKVISANPLINQLMSVTSTAADTSSMYSETVVTVNDLMVFSVLKVLALVVLFFVIKLVVVLIGKLLTSILSSRAILGTANRSAGMAIGFAVGLLICYVIFVFAVPTLGSLNIIKVPDTYTQSIILSWFNSLVPVVK